MVTAMREFNKVSPSIWQNEAFQALPLRERYLYLYLRTCIHQNSAGCFMLPVAYACADLGNWTAAEYSESLETVATADMIAVDMATREVLITDWFSDNGPMNENHRKGTQRIIDAIKSPALKKSAQEGLTYSRRGFVMLKHGPPGRHSLPHCSGCR
jgi:hypothetical protein